MLWDILYYTLTVLIMQQLSESLICLLWIQQERVMTYEYKVEYSTL